ncbi:MAG: M48 family metalloprotease [Saprospiraceae bacterium]
MRKISGTLLIAIVMALFTLGRYYMNTDYNEVTGEEQRISLSVEEEIMLGLQSREQMAQQHGGLDRSAEDQQLVDKVGRRIVDQSAASGTDYQYDFHLLADPNTVNAFALPGGQVFITRALYTRLEDINQLAGVLGHEVGHVVARHSAERISQQRLAEGLSGAAAVGMGGNGGGQLAGVVANLMTMSYGREQELESDELGVRFMIEAGYTPESLIGVMDILEAASGGSRQAEFSSTHPSPENRRERIRESIVKYGG